MNDNPLLGMTRRGFLTDAAVVGGLAFLGPWVAPVIGEAHAVGSGEDSPTGFDPVFALDVALPLCEAAHNQTWGRPLNLPPGYVQTAQIRVDQAAASATADRHPLITTIATNTNLFGLMGRNAATRTAFVAVRGTEDEDDVVRDVDGNPENYTPIGEFGQVHTGFQTVYHLVRPSIAANLATASAGCDQILVTGHSLGAALAVLAAPDIFQNMPPNIKPRLITFGGPKTGLADFATAFNNVIESCFRVVNADDIVPYLPPIFYEQVGAEVAVDGGSNPLLRHTLSAYRDGLQAVVNSTA